MALNIEGFTPEGSVWSIKGTATASSESNFRADLELSSSANQSPAVTVVGFSLLMLSGLLLWKYRDDIIGIILKRKPLRAGDETSQQGFDSKGRKGSTGWTISVIRTRNDVSNAQLQYA